MSSPPHRLIHTFFLSFPSGKRSFSSAASFPNLRRLLCPSAAASSLRLYLSYPQSSAMPFRPRGQSSQKQKQWKEKPRSVPSTSVDPGDGSNGVTESMGKLSVAGLSGGNSVGSSGGSSVQLFGTLQTSVEKSVVKGQQRGVWMPKNYVTSSGTVAAHAPLSADAPAPVAAAASMAKEKEVDDRGSLTGLFQGHLGENFVVDSNTFSRAQIRATFYPKFENEKSDQEIRLKMIEIVTNGLATLEVTLKHSGSLFMYAGHMGGAYAKNSFGNVYTAVGVFVLARTFKEAWGTQASKKQVEFNDFLEEKRMCISMELVTAVLGDHGQRPIDDYVVVTAVTELGDGKPKFYSTPELIAFCREWRLPSNHVWLFSTRKSVTSFFAAYDALCEEGTATPVCQALNEVADVAIPGSKDHIKAQGEILEGLVVRIVSHDSSEHMMKVLKEFPAPPFDGLGLELGPSLREVCAANRSDEKQQIKALLQITGTLMCPDQSDWFGDGDSAHSRNADRSVLSNFLQANAADYSTTKLQEMIRLMRQRHFPAAFKCYYNFHKIQSMSKDNLSYKMVIHVHSDSVFRRYQQEMRRNRGLWPLYRGFFVDIDLFKVHKEKASILVKESSTLLKNMNGSSASGKTADGLADDDANLMIKLKFLTYKLRTFLIRNGLSILFKDGPSSYKTYYLRQMRIWGTSAAKQREMSKMLDEWAIYIRRKCGHKQLSSSTYLSEAEQFLEQYAKRSSQNHALIGSAGNLVGVENFQAIIGETRDEEGDLRRVEDSSPPSPTASKLDKVLKDEGLIVFFPGIPGCAKSALCKELLNNPGGLGDNRPVRSLMGDIIKGRYWPKVADERKKNPYTITLADKNAPNEEVWRLIEDMCRSTKASAVPVVPDSEGTASNPFSFEALAVFIFRVLQRVNHPGNLDKSSPNPGYVLLMFYHLYDGKSRKDFEHELLSRFGALVKMPLLKTDREPLPEPLKNILEEGINLYRLHSSRHGRAEPSKGGYAKEWMRWEKGLQEVLLRHADYLNSIQIPLDLAVKEVTEQLKGVIKGDLKTPSSEKRRFGNIVFAAVTLPVLEIRSLLNKLASTNTEVEAFLKAKELEKNLSKAHVTLAHKASHGVTAVASYGVYHQLKVPVEFTALFFSDKVAALETRLGCIDGEKISSKNEWPHSTLWAGGGAAPKLANALPKLHSEGGATRIDIDPPFTVDGVVDFY